MIYYVGGINGAGKTFLLQEVVKRNNNFIHIKGSKLLMDYLDIGDGDYSKLRSLPTDFKNRKFGEIMGSINIDQYGGKDLLIDAHFLNIIDGNISRVTDTWIKNMDALILVEATPNEIVERILADNRDRRMLRKEAYENERSLVTNIENYMHETKEEFHLISKKYNLPNLIIRNEQENIDLAVNSFISFHNKLTLLRN